MINRHCKNTWHGKKSPKILVHLHVMANPEILNLAETVVKTRQPTDKTVVTSENTDLVTDR